MGAWRGEEMVGVWCRAGLGLGLELGEAIVGGTGERQGEEGGGDREEGLESGCGGGRGMGMGMGSGEWR